MSAPQSTDSATREIVEAAMREWDRSMLTLTHPQRVAAGEYAIAAELVLIEAGAVLTLDDLRSILAAAVEHASAVTA